MTILEALEGYRCTLATFISDYKDTGNNIKVAENKLAELDKLIYDERFKVIYDKFIILKVNKDKDELLTLLIDIINKKDPEYVIFSFKRSGVIKPDYEFIFSYKLVGTKITFHVLDFSNKKHDEMIALENIDADTLIGLIDMLIYYN